MIKILMLVLAFVVFSTPSYAKKLEVYDLTEEQAAELALKAAQMKAIKQNPADVSDRMAEYAEIGQKYGVALAATAKELGIAADEILNTTVGKIALVLIVWKVMGEDVVGLMIGVPWLLFGAIVWIYIFRRIAVISSIVKEPVEGRWYRKKTVTYYPSGPRIDGTRWGMFVASVLIWAPAFIMIFG